MGTNRLDGSSSAGADDDDEMSLMGTKNAIKIILLGDSAVGKSKLVERFLLDGFQPHRLSTFALTLYRYDYKCPDGRRQPVDIWDTAGQERFQSLHPSYFYKAHACIMVFDVTRKVTYKNLERWYEELEEYCPGIPVFVVANKIDIDYKVTQKQFNFAAKRQLPFFFVSASDGTNVVKVFTSAIEGGIQCKEKPPDDLYSQVLELLEDNTLGQGRLHDNPAKEKEKLQNEVQIC
eukprot:TRINITY_DN20103_c0_g1_i1.p1 TRINITY_DN20103_c0_g1~~TRINITY_DN20103_c0_g1_i1.p1  ORF type:complete len:234 (+),score=54.67 TRINITY_DN20103_c0_g1_i1:182-883(+)